MLAQVPDAMNWSDWIDRFGWPAIILLVILMIAKSLWTWAKPHLDNLIAAANEAKKAEAKRHESQAESLRKLTDRTIEIQQATERSVSDIKKDLPTSCKWKPRHTD